MGTRAESRTLTVGEAEVTRIVEYEGSTRAPESMFPQVPAGAWKRHRDWLAPDYWDTRTNLLRTGVQTWVLRSAGTLVLIDTGVGAAKERPGLPAFHRLESDYLGRLAAAGIAPEHVDVVVNTHLHADHVGWNTRLDGGEWVPAFPSARYLFPRADYEFWDPSADRDRRTGPANQNAFEDSVAPIMRAGLGQLWEDRYVIDENVTLLPAPGHTPGASVVELDSRGARAVFVGDVLHNPIQVAEPDCNSCFCEDEAAARATRRRILAKAVDQRQIVFPAHLRGRRPAMTVEHRGPGFAIGSWIDFEPEAVP